MTCVLCGATMVPVDAGAGVMLVHAWELEQLLVDEAAA